MEYTTIQLPEWKGWRIAGSDLDWQIQEWTKHSGKEGGYYWHGVKFYPTLDWALAAAFDRTLKETGKRIDALLELADEYRRIRKSISKAVGR